MRVKLRISRQTGSQINKGGPSREAQHQKEHVEMEMGMRDSTTSQDARSPGSWTSQKGAPPLEPPEGAPPLPSDFWLGEERFLLF